MFWLSVYKINSLISQAIIQSWLCVNFTIMLDISTIVCVCKQCEKYCLMWINIKYKAKKFWLIQWFSLVKELQQYINMATGSYRLEEETHDFEKGRIRALRDERLYIQKKTFTKWVNSFLIKVRIEVNFKLSFSLIYIWCTTLSWLILRNHEISS